MTFSKQFREEIATRLNKDEFSAEDFEFEESFYNTTNLKIKFKYEEKYYFILRFNKERSDFIVEYSPGDVTSVTTIKNCDKYKCLESIWTWLVALQIENKSSISGRQIYNTQLKIKEIEDAINERFSNEDSTFFSKEEGEVLKDKLEQLEELFKEKLENNYSEATKLRKEVEFLKVQVENLSKKKWITAFSIKLYNWVNRNPEAAKQIGQAAVALLPQEVESTIQSLLPPTGTE